MPETNEQLPIERLHSDEAASLFGLFAASQEIKSALTRLEKRLKTIPGAYDGTKTTRETLDEVLKSLLETVPTDKLLSLKRNMKYMAFRVYLAKPVAVPNDETIMNADDLTTLIHSAHDYRCVACDNDCDRCDLGKALDRSMIQTRRHGESWSWINIDKEYDDKDVIL